jgi:hypothetical protein
MLIVVVGVMVAVDAVNDVMIGVPLHVDTGVRVGVIEPGTAIVTFTVVPKPVPFGARIRHCPVRVPLAVVAVIGTETLTVAPGAVLGTLTTVLLVIASPEMNPN